MSDKAPAPLEPFTTPIPLLGSRWKHWKGATTTVTGVGHHTETGEAVIHYTYDGHFWSRPQSQWHDEARPGVKRFTLIE